MGSQRREVVQHRAIRFIRRRRLLVAGIAVLALALPMAASSGGGASLSFKAAPASATGPDTVQYVQTTGSSGTYIQYVPGNGTESTTESVTSGGGCATPSPSGIPLLGFSGSLYPDGTYTAGTQTPAIVGAYKQRTGVCSLGQAWSIDNVPTGTAPKTGAEALDFSLGSNPLVAGRRFTRATLYLQRSDKLTGSVSVELVESLQGSPVASQCYGLGSTSTVQVDTNAPDNTVCPTAGDLSTSGFDTIEIRLLTNGGSVSVVGPSSTFYLTSQICGTQQIQTSSSQDPTFGQVTIGVTLSEPSTVCKSYAGFFAQQTVNPDGTVNKVAAFNSFGSAGTHFVFTIDWGNRPYCTPDPKTGPVCPPTQVSADNITYFPQTFCAAATAGQLPCTTSKTYQYVTVNNTTYTHISETWDGLIDSWFHG
jgi:hypothetical protein